MGKLKGKVAIVTGAASGIGRASALAFHQEGACVVAADLEEEAGSELEKQITSAGGDCVFVRTDVSKEADVQKLIETALARHGALHVLYNNAGVGGKRRRVEETALEDFEQMVGVNLRGVFLGLKYGIPAIRSSGGGSIINTASVAAFKGFAKLGVYCATKGGVLQLTKAAALECAAEGIRINAICPGPIVTGMTRPAIEATRGNLLDLAPMGRYGQPEEVARLAVYLASDESSFSTGAAFVVDGGAMAG
jgi:NAD(P)-dependent dehydrogenase (short-subunit alcohol dehydrogenase family)